MKRTILVRLVTGALMLALAMTLPSCKKETDVKPKEDKTTSITDAPKVNDGGGGNSGGQGH